MFKWFATVWVIVAVVFAVPGISHGQEISAKPLVENLNEISSILVNPSLTEAEIQKYSGIACSAYGTLIEGEYVQVISEFLMKNYPDIEEIKQFVSDENNISNFSEFERDALVRFGAYPDVATLVMQAIREDPDIALSLPPELSEEMKSKLADLQSIACELANYQVVQMADVSLETAEAKTRALAWGVVGGVVVVVNVAVGLEAGGVGVGVMAVVSGGWGWNRVEDAWGSLF